MGGGTPSVEISNETLLRCLISFCLSPFYGVVGMVEQYFDFSDRAALVDPAYERAGEFDRSKDLNGGVRTGALVATASGLKPIETLSKNDLVLTRDNGYVSLTNVQRMPATLVGPQKFDVCITAHALGPFLPAQDICVAASQLVLLQGTDDLPSSEAFVRAADLVHAFRGIRFVEAKTDRYVITCAQHEILLIDDLWSGTGYTSASYGVSLQGNSHAKQRILDETVAPLSRNVADLSSENVVQLRAILR